MMLEVLSAFYSVTPPLAMESSETVLTMTADLDPVPNLSCAGRGVSVSVYMVYIPRGGGSCFLVQSTTWGLCQLRDRC